MNKVNTRVVLSFIIGTLFNIWGYLIALLHLGNMQAQHRTPKEFFEYIILEPLFDPTYLPALDLPE